jgi:DNA-directed RNA polymerase specialized sigma24 family protein
MSPQDTYNLGPLLERSRGGELEARNALLGKLRSFLQALVRSWLGADLARQLADSDVVQEVSLSIHRNFASFRGAGVPELLAWVRAIAFHAVANHKKRLGRERPGDPALQDVPAREPEPLERVEQAEGWSG